MTETQFVVAVMVLVTAVATAALVATVFEVRRLNREDKKRANDNNIVKAQRILDEYCNGDLTKAMTYAAFRGYTRRYMREHWPVTVEHGKNCTCADEPDVVRVETTRRRLDGRGGRLEE